MCKSNRSLLSYCHCSLLLVSVSTAPAGAGGAGWGDECCADLQERIAELEALSVRRVNRSVSLNLSGQVSHGLLYWDDGRHHDAYVVNDSNDQTYFQLSGEARISAAWSAGFSILIRVNEPLSGDVSQVDDDAFIDGDGPINIWEVNWYLQNESLGRLTLGQASRASDGAPEVDLSRSSIVAYAGVQDVGGGFALRRADGALAALAWGDLFDHFNGDTANVLRWDSTEVLGFTLSASWGEDDIWDAALFYAGEWAGFKLEGAIAYTSVVDTDGAFADVDQNILVGSVSLLHVATGLNATLSAGQKFFDAAARDADGLFRRPKDAGFIYGKLGWIAQLSDLGATVFYGEYGLFKDFTSVTGDAAVVASLALGGGATRITGNKAQVWGFGAVQHIDAADMSVYAGYRNHRAEFDLVNGAGNRVAASGIDRFHTIMSGAMIRF